MASRLALLLVLSPFLLLADVSLPAIFGHHMVIQRGVPLHVWGWADPGEQVTVTLGEASAETSADADRCWHLQLPARDAGEDLTLLVVGKNRIEIKDVLVGEVWLGSGQSNMEWTLSRTANAQQQIAAADFPKLRLFKVQRATAGLPQMDLQGRWEICTPQSAAQFSAVAYYFGRELHRELGVPVGMIASAWGGTRIEPWTPIAGFELVDDKGQIGTIAAADEQYRADIEAKLPLIAAWLETTRAGLAADELPVTGPPQPQHPLNSHGRPTGLYNAMIEPLIPFPIKGAIWYQGESNLGDGLAYRERMAAMIGGWRQVWNRGDFPFYFVQLAPYAYGDPEATTLPLIWEAQRLALDIPNTGMAVITDLATVRNIHPPNKEDVGKRLALIALAKDYGKDLVWSGPMFAGLAVQGDKARVRFDHATGLKTRDGQAPSHWEIAGEDGQWQPATAVIEGETVIVSSPEVKAPAAVRFGWRNGAMPNLVNAAGLPASPFRGTAGAE